MNKDRAILNFIRIFRVSVTAAALLSAGLIVTNPSTAWAQETAAESDPNSEAIPAISIVKPASGKTYEVVITGANGYVHPQSGGAAISSVTVLIHRDSGGKKGYLDGSGQFQDVSQGSSGSYYREAYVDKSKGTWSVNISFPSGDFEGKYTLKALVVDNAGKQNSATAGFNISDNNHTVSGSVKTRDNKGVSGVPVGARPSDGDTWQTATTDDQGSYSLSNLASGSWVVTVRDRISDPHSTTVTLTGSSRYASASFFISDSQSLIDSQLSQSASDALRAAGFTDNSRFGDIIDNAPDTRKPHYGTHQQSGSNPDYGNAIDIPVEAPTPAKRDAEIHALRMQGFAAWYRSTPGNEHYHIVWAGSPTENLYNQEQIAAFNQRLDGYAHEATETNQPITDEEAKAVRDAFNRVPNQNISNFQPYSGTH